MADFNKLIRKPNEKSANEAYNSIIPEEVKKTGVMDEVNQGIANNTDSKEVTDTALSGILDSTEEIMEPAINHVIANHLELIQDLTFGIFDTVFKGMGI